MRRRDRQFDVATPHFRVPFQFGGVGGGALMNDQDTTEDIVDCIKTIIAFPIDSLDSQPGFGVPDVLFKGSKDAVAEELKAAVLDWEERAGIDMEETGALIEDPFVQNLIMKVGSKVD